MKCLFSLVLFFAPYLLMAESNPLWMRYSSISPDGETIVFTYKNDIYKVSSSGGVATAITANPALDYMPIWSPDSKTIAFASDRNGSFDIFSVSAQGGTPKRLTFHSGNESPSSFSPDGKEILFSASIQDLASNVAFPKSYLSELYSVPASGGRIKQILSTPAEKAKYSSDGKTILFQDKKGGENQWRKHHISSITRDIQLYDIQEKRFTKLTTFGGEDRDPCFSPDGQSVYFLSEMYGSNFNICRLPLFNPKSVTQLTEFKNHPVRFLSVSNNEKLCFTYDGEIYVKEMEKKSKKVAITILADFSVNNEQYFSKSSGAREMAVSPDGKEVAFVIRGNVFVTAVGYSSTKQITKTPGQERNISFSPDGRSILYASERKGAWNIYETKIESKTETNFSSATLLKEEIVVENNKETFLPKYSPDGKEVAFLEERVILKVINLKTKAQREILGKEYNYSYADGDQWYRWSPDGKSFLVKFSPNNFVTSDVGVISASGKGKPKNITNSGYSDSSPKWVLKGNAMIWKSDRNGYRSHGSWGSEKDVYAMFFNKEEYNKFKLTKEEFELQKEEKDKDDDKKEGKDSTVTIDFDGLEDRKIRLTINSSYISDMVLSPKGDKLYYLSKFEKGYDLWEKKIRENQTKLVAKLSGYGGSLTIDKDGKNLFMFSGGRIIKIKTSDFKKKTISFKAEYVVDLAKEREVLFEHVWRQMQKKFYKVDMHGADWAMYKTAYSKFLPHINNDYDFAELLSELLGETNASHTGAYARGRKPGGDKTASLGVFYDWNFTGKGLIIAEVVEKGPLFKTKKQITSGMVIEKINGKEILEGKDFYHLLNRLSGKNTLISLFDPKTGKRFNETIKPISEGQFGELLYKRWVEQRRDETEKLSGGKIGYVHVRGMNSSSFREVYSETLGRNYHKDALIVDTRYNGGGWLHDDLATLLSGKKYVDFVPRGQYVGSDPFNKWNKPSAVLISEGNYSDGHAFPYVYKTLGIGKLIGMPVPGTMTAVWWEWLHSGTVVFGIPQVGMRDFDGNFLENTQLEPDYKIENTPEVVITGEDQQLAKAVEVLLEESKK